MTIFNVAVWGLGSHARKRILPTLFSMKQVRVIGVCSRNSEIVKESSIKWNCHAWTQPDDMLKNSEVDIVYISTPIGVHFSMSKKALNAGKHVWCEKPLTCNLKETQFLISLAEKKNKMITESFMYLYHSQFQRIKKFVDESEKLHSIICRFGIPSLDNPGFRNDSKLCGGAFWDVACYPISAVTSLFKDQTVKVLFSEVTRQENSLLDSGGRVLLRFSKGVSAYLEWGVGVAYKNEIDLWAENSSFFTDKIFSKPVDFVPNYYEKDLNGNLSIKNGQKCEQFLEMFSVFIGMLNNENEKILERKVILKRAQLMDDILSFKI
ncbi:Gfo/Idh/MocA family oxidoreductase [Candidatus Pseudothioglobus singularis]|nr:Gfo/Idh/MocA family oxidoreductase [Candidatus Pseudothioglobus singularis]